MKEQPSSPRLYHTEVNRMLDELLLLNWFAMQEKEKRRLMIASLESLLDTSSDRPRSLASKRDS